MDHAEISRLRDAVLADIVPIVGGEKVDVRVIEAGVGVVVVARVADKSVRPAVLRIIQRRFPGAPIKFEP
jgi:hypothetical protein